MPASVPCVCGKQYVWKPELAGKRVRCKCGQAISFPIQPPVSGTSQPVAPPAQPKPPEAIANADDPLGLGDLSDVQEGGQVIDQPTVTVAPRTAPLNAPTANGIAPLQYAAPVPGATLAKKLALFGGGLLGLAIFAAWPMLQVLRHEHSITLSFKGIVVSAMLAMVGLAYLILGDDAIMWKKIPGRSATTYQKAIIGVILIASLALTGACWLFFNAHGYTVRF